MDFSNQRSRAMRSDSAFGNYRYKTARGKATSFLPVRFQFESDTSASSATDAKVVTVVVIGANCFTQRLVHRHSGGPEVEKKGRHLLA